MAATKPPTTFEAALKELEKVVASLENGQLPLEEALAAYQRGAELLRFCQEKLSDAEQRIRVFDGENFRPMTDGDSGRD